MLHSRQIWPLMKGAVSAWIADYAPSMGAAIAYYTAFSIAPLLLLVISVAGLVFGRDVVQGEIVSQAQGLMGQQGASAIEDLLKSASEPTTGLMATIASIGLLIFGATTVFGEVQNSLDRIWHVPEKQKPSGVWGFIRTRMLSFGIVLILAFLLLVSLAVSSALAALGSWWGEYFSGQEALLQLLNYAVSVLFSTTLFAMMYKLMPRTQIAWRDVWVGAVVTAILFEIGKFAIGLYIGKSAVASAFGAAGSLAVLLIWVYYSSQIFLLGAEFTRLYAGERNPDASLRSDADREAPDRRPQPA